MKLKSLTCFLLLLTAVLLIVSCTAANVSPMLEYSGSAAEYGLNDSARPGGADSDSSVSDTPDGGVSALSYAGADTSRKVVYTSTLEIETLDFDAAVDTVKKLTERFGGYFESSDVTGGKRGGDGGHYELRSAYFTVRIPAERFSEFLDSKGEIGNVYKDVTKAQDVTLRYQDNESRLKSLRTQEERVSAILEKADKLSDVFEIESTLANIRYEIESLTSRQLLLSSQVEYSTADISLYEVRSITITQEPPLTLGDRISSRFSSTLEGMKQLGEDFLVWLLGSSPLILIWGAVIAAAALIVRKLAFKRKEKTTAGTNPPDGDKQ